MDIIKSKPVFTFPSEVLYMIFSYLEIKDALHLGYMCKLFYNIFIVKFMSINPANYVFYHKYNDRRIDRYEFTDIKTTPKRNMVVFDIRHSTCNDCVLTRGYKKFENLECRGRYNSERRMLKVDRNGKFFCNHPYHRGFVYAIRKTEFDDLFKSACSRCGILKSCMSCPVVDGNCGIPSCRKNVLMTNYNVYTFSGKSFVHHHDLCRDCFDHIPKTMSVNLSINNSYPMY